MSSYYYLMAQLPGIPQNGQISLTYAQFKDIALRHLTPSDRAIIEDLSLEPTRGTGKTGCSFIDSWYAHERAIRFALERARAARLGRDIDITAEEDELVTAMPETRQIAASAIALDNPLEAERLLDRARIAFVDDLKGTHSFDSDAVFAYALTLLLRERNNRFSVEAGRESYTSIYNGILGEKS